MVNLQVPLPRAMVDAARWARDRLQIGLAPINTVDASRLRPANAIDLSAIVGSKALAAAATAAIERAGPHLTAQPYHSTGTSDRRLVYQLIRGLDAHAVLEIGTWVGGTTLAIAQALADRGGGRLTTVDLLDVNAPDGPWRRGHAPYPPAVALERLGLAKLVEFRVSNSIEFLRGTPDTYDLVFLDGSHQAGHVYAELPLALARLRIGGVVLLHDYYPPGVRRRGDGRLVIHGPRLALARAMREQPEDLTVLPVPSLPGAAGTTLAVVARRA